MDGTSTPSDAAIRKKMEKLVPKVDLETITTKQFIVMLSERMGGADLSKKKKFIKSTITEILDAMEDESSSAEEEEEEEDEDEESEEEEEEEEPPEKKRKHGLAAVKEISDELAAFLGKGKEMARTEVVKGLWDYIKANHLQNPDDRREILLDDKMKELFHVDKFTMFTMNKYIGAHIHPYTKVNLTERSESALKLKTQKAAKKRKAAADKATKGGKAKTARKQGTQAPWRLSKELASVVGKDILPRPQVTQALWVYIKKHGLQNPEDKREIICDDMLKQIMGGNSKVTIFTMNKHITPHMVEKLDKSAYIHETVEKSDEEPEESDEDEESEDDNGSGEESDSE